MKNKITEDIFEIVWMFGEDGEILGINPELNLDMNEKQADKYFKKYMKEAWDWSIYDIKEASNDIQKCGVFRTKDKDELGYYQWRLDRDGKKSTIKTWFWFA